MKKAIFLLLPLLSCVACYTQDDSNAPQGEGLILQRATVDEYEVVQNEYEIAQDEYEAVPSDEQVQLAAQEDNALQEYEQHVCDAVTVKPPKPYSISTILTSIGVTLLIQYVSLTEKAKVCLAGLKHTLAKWLCANS